LQDQLVEQQRQQLQTQQQLIQAFQAQTQSSASVLTNNFLFGQSGSGTNPNTDSATYNNLMGDSASSGAQFSAVDDLEDFNPDDYYIVP
jgi:hypothetical protein